MEQGIATTDWRVILTGIGVIVASAALFINGLNFYFQHFHKRKKLFLAAEYREVFKRHQTSGGTIVLGARGYTERLLEVILTNSGDTPIIIRKIELRGGQWSKKDGFGFEKQVDDEYAPLPNCFEYNSYDQESKPPYRLDPGEHLVSKFQIGRTIWQNVENWGKKGKYCKAENELQVDHAVYLKMILSDGSLKEESIDVATAVYTLGMEEGHKYVSWETYYIDEGITMSVLEGVNALSKVFNSHLSESKSESVNVV